MFAPDWLPVIAEPSTEGALGRVALNTAGVIGSFLSMGLLGSGLVVFAKPHLETVSDTASHSYLRSFAVGLIAQVLVVPTVALVVVGLVVSVVGVLLIPFVLAVAALIIAAAMLGGFLAVAHAMGEARTRKQMAKGAALSPNGFRYLLTGLGGLAALWLAWALFGWIPLAGLLVLTTAVVTTWVMTTIGLGAAVLSRGGIQPTFAGRFLPAEMLTDEYLWATPRQGVPAVKRPPKA